MENSMIDGYLTIAVDFDGVISEGRDVTDKVKIMDNAKEVLTRLERTGKVKLILWTCRAGPALLDAIEALTDNNMTHLFSAVNEQLPEIKEKYDPHISRKVGADIYFDDRNHGAKIDWLDFEKDMYEILKQI